MCFILILAKVYHLAQWNEKKIANQTKENVWEYKNKNYEELRVYT